MAVKMVRLDPGMYGVKAGCGDKKFYVKSLVDTIDNVATNDGYRIKVASTEYVVGNEGIPFDFKVDKHKIATKILTNLAISKLVDAGDEVNLVIGMPVEHWLDKTRRAKYENFIASISVMSLVEGERSTPMNFRIKKVVALPETIGYVARHERYSQKSVGVIDCGGGNIQGGIYKNGIPIRESCFTLNEGGYFYLNTVKTAINSKFGLNYQYYQVQELIENGSRHERKEEITEEVKKVTKIHFMKVIRECLAHNWNLNDMEIAVIGGSSNLFKDAISELLPNSTISDDAMWDNVEGFGVLGRVLFKDGIGK